MRIERVARAVGTPFERLFPETLSEMVAQIVDFQGSVLVLGSAQSLDLVDGRSAAAAGVDIVRRHSGGGAVLLQAGRSLWVDVLLPRPDRRWVDDVGESFHWLGEVWAGALATLGVSAAVHRGRLEKTTWGSLVCFGAVGPGEVLVGGRKVVGISQRRSRTGARFQCLVSAAWRPEDLLELLDLAPGERAAAAEDLRDRAAGAGVPLPALERAFIARLHQE
jgi:lipoate-protein ligase A